METRTPETDLVLSSDTVARRREAVEALEEYMSSKEKVLYEPQAGVMHEIQRFIADRTEESAWGYVSLPTGSGKTVLFQQLAEATGLRTLVVAPKRKLVEQAQHTFEKFDSSVSTGLLYSHEKNAGADVVITTGQSLIKHTESSRGMINPLDFDLLILDEAHRALGPRTQEVVRNNFRHTIAIGFTATKRFDNKRSIDSLLPEEIYDMPIAEAVEKKLISPFSNMVLLSEYARMSRVSIRNGEYDPKQLNRAINIDPRNRALAEFYDKNLKGQRAVFFCNSIDHSETMALALQEQGVSAEAIHSKLSRSQQQEIYDRFERPIDSGGLEAICSVRMLTEGFDSPSASVCINVSPTLSLVLEQQRSGRVQRMDPANPGKHAVIIDVVDHTDFGSYRPPVIYSHKNIAAKARVTSNGYHPSFDPENIAPIEGLELMHSPAEVESLAEELIGLNYHEAKPREGWYNEKEIAELSGYSLRTVQNAMWITRARQPELFESEDMVSKNLATSGLLYSLSMAEQLIMNAELANQAPRWWLKGSQIAILAGLRERTDLQSPLKKVQARLPDYHVGPFVDEIGQGNAMLFYSPKAINEVLEPYDVVYDPKQPPENWTALEAFEEKHGEEEVNKVIYGQYGIMAAQRNRSHEIEFSAGPHFSPALSQEIDAVFTAPEGRRHAGEFYDEYQETRDGLKKVLDWSKQSGRELNGAFVWRSIYGLRQEFVSQELFESWPELKQAYEDGLEASQAEPKELLESKEITIPKTEKKAPTMRERYPHLYDETEDDGTDQAQWEEEHLGPAEQEPAAKQGSGPTEADLEALEKQLDSDEAEDDDKDIDLGLIIGVEAKLNQRFPLWRQKAECLHSDANLFFPERGASTRKAREMCTQCTVGAACLIYALETGEKFGIWGGMSERVRRQFKKVVNIGGTWDDIIEIQEKSVDPKTATIAGSRAIEYAKAKREEILQDLILEQEEVSGAA